MPTSGRSARAPRRSPRGSRRRTSCRRARRPARRAARPSRSSGSSDVPRALVGADSGRPSRGVSNIRAPIAAYSGPTARAAVLGAHPRRDPQQPQPGGVPGLVLGREVGVVVDVRVEDAQRDEPPVHPVVALRGDHADPLAGHPGERAHRVEVEVQIVITLRSRLADHERDHSIGLGLIVLVVGYICDQFGPVLARFGLASRAVRSSDLALDLNVIFGLALRFRYHIGCLSLPPVDAADDHGVAVAQVQQGRPAVSGLSAGGGRASPREPLELAAELASVAPVHPGVERDIHLMKTSEYFVSMKRGRDFGMHVILCKGRAASG